MLSTRFSIASSLRAAALLLAAAVLSACAAPAARVAGRRDRRRREPAGQGGAAAALWLGRPRARADRAQPGERGAAGAEPTCATPPSTSPSIRRPAPRQGGAAAASQAVAEGAKIIVGPLFSTETAGAQSPAASGGLSVLSFSNNASVAGGNVYILGTTFENTADRLVAYGQSPRT